MTASDARTLQCDSAHREEMVGPGIPHFLRSTSLEFAGLPPDKDEPFGQKKKTYLCFELAKPLERSP